MNAKELIFVLLASLFVLVGVAQAAESEPNALLSARSLTSPAIGDDAAADKELKQLRTLVLELSLRIEALEKRLNKLEHANDRLLPWQKEQPFYWDSRIPLRIPQRPR